MHPNVSIVTGSGSSRGHVSTTNPLAVTDAANGVPGTPAAVATTVQGMGYVGGVAVTRPANTTAYTAGDVIGVADVNTAANAGSAIHEFQNVGPSGGHIMITGVDLRIDLTAVPSGMTSFRLYLYSAATDAILDNAAWDLSSAGDRASFRGYIDLGTPVDLGSTLYVQTDQVNKQFKLAPGSTSLYGLLVTNGAYPPASGTVYSMKLRGVSV